MRVGRGRREVDRKAARRLGLLAGVTVVAMLALSCSVAVAAPVWKLDTNASTTAAPGSTLTYLVELRNLGDVPSDGSTITLTATLPLGLTYASSFGAFDCSSTAVGATVVTCTSSAVVAPVSASLTPVIRVAVDPSASGVLTSSFQVSGGDPSNPTTSTVDPTAITTLAPGFGFDAFDAQITDAAGEPYTQAGGHPYAFSTEIDFNTIDTRNHLPPNAPVGSLWPVEAPKDVFVDLPPGSVGNPTGAAQCTAPDLANGQGIVAKPLCSPASQVGVTYVRINGFGFFDTVAGPLPVYNMVPPPDVPARFGFNVSGSVVTLDAKLRSAGDYGLSVDATDIPEGVAIAGTTVTFWGNPADPSHDPQRACRGQLPPSQFGGPSCATDAQPSAFVRLPTSCTAEGAGLPLTAHIDSWAHPGALSPDGSADLSDPSWKSSTIVSHDPPSYPAPPSQWGGQQGPSGCDRVPFDPSFSFGPAAPARAGAPSAFSFDLRLPQNSDPNAIGESDLRKAVVTLPEGVRVSPSVADGLAGCTLAQVGLHSTADASCPDASKLGSVTIETPLLDQPVTGSAYLASPNDNPFGTLMAIYLVAKGPGVILKLSGKIEADPQTGQVTTTFDNQPQLPFSDLHLEFKSGPRAPLETPPTCKTYTTHAELTSWSGKTVSLTNDFVVDRASDGGPCAALGFSPGFSAGTADPVAGKSSAFLLSLTRSDRDQELRSLSVGMPDGLLGRIASTTLCPEAAALAGTCSDASKVGGVTVAAGAGSNPFFITAGRAYITGPYKGAPFGLSIVVPAVAGPFDLGNVVVRAAIYLDKQTARLRVVSDPLPTIVQGIPLNVRVVRVSIDRPRFIVNPTSCATKSITGTIGSTQGAVVHASSRFKVGECANLRLAPKIVLSVGARHRTGANVSTPFTTVLTQSPGQSNLKSVSVSLPTTLNARLGVVNQACKLTEFEAGHCTSKAKVGTAVAVTPLLRDPLKGSAYFVKNPHRALPDLMVALRGQVALDLTGKVTIPGGTHLATRFDTIPDAPITKFTLRLVAGKNGPLGTAVNLCTASARAATAAIGVRGQNGALIQTNQRLHVNGCPKAKTARKARHA